jgi:acetyl-CoA carboxylase carboxyl transferase subunit beta
MADWFRRRSKTNRDTNAPQRDNTPIVAPPATANVPEGLVVKCQKCGAILTTKDFERDRKVCPKCGYHHRLTADERIAYTVDEGTFAEWGNDFVAVDPLGFPGYQDKIQLGMQDPSNRNDGLVIGTATIGGFPCVLGVVDFFFARLAGTMGSVFGEKFVRAADQAIERRLPFVIFCASGGARMQEGLFGLMQMAKTSAAVAQLSEAGIPYIVILTDPTTGGALASFASLGDVIYAEPAAYVAFAGTRVAQQAQTEKPPENYQTAEFQEDHGMLDRVIARKEVPTTLARTLAFFGAVDRAPEAADIQIDTGSDGESRANGIGGEASEDGLLSISSAESARLNGSRDDR